MRTLFPGPPSRPIFYGSAAGFLLLTLSLAGMGPIGKDALLFGFLYGFSFLLLFLLYKTFPNEWPKGRQLAFILFLALLSRLFFLSFPASFDVNRYVWEGYIFNHGFNPYLHAPNDPLLKPLVNEVWHHINHKDASACYPPLAMLLFSLLASLSLSPLLFKCAVMFFEFAAIPLLILLATSRGVRPSRLIFYALNPLVLVFIAGEGHLDAVQVFFICLSLYSFMGKKDGWGFFALGCAVMTKYFALVLLPFVLNARNWKKSLVLFVPFLSYIPFWDSGPHLFSSLLPFGTLMHYNDSLTIVFRTICGANAFLVSLFFLLMAMGAIFLLVHDPLRSVYLAAGALLLFLPTLHPWYLLLITPFLVFFPSRAWIFFHLAVVFTFPVLGVEYQTGVFQEIHWLKLFEYLPFYGLLVWDVLRPRRPTTLSSFQPAADFSIVVPTLNEEEHIEGALRSVKEQKGFLEAIVVDGGSTDRTRELAGSLGAKVISGEQGRGFQIKAGIAKCRGDIILILHADCRIRTGTFERIRSKLNKSPKYIGGALGMRYMPESSPNRILAWLNNGRARMTGISFGDQAQFFRKESLGLMGGFPNQMLMEDVELSLRFKETGLPCYIPKGVTVSERRWVRIGFFMNFRRVITLCLTYLVQRRLGLGNAKRKDFYDRYYGRKERL